MVDLDRTKNGKPSPKRKLGHESERQRHIQTHNHSPSKKRKVIVELQTPRHTPPSSKRQPSHSSGVARGKFYIRLPPPSHVKTLEDDMKTKKVGQSSHLPSPVPTPPPRLSGPAHLRSCHQESQLCPSTSQFREGLGQDCDFNDRTPLAQHSTLMDITVGCL